MIHKVKLTDSESKKYQRILMGVIGTVMIGSSYAFTFFDDTIITIGFILMDGFATILSVAFFYAMLMPKMNVKGILAGYSGGLLAQVISEVTHFKLLQNYFF